MLRSTIEPVLSDIGFIRVGVDDSNDRMDVWDIEEGDVASIAVATAAADMQAAAGGSGHGCSHAQKAAQRRAAERVNIFLTQEREAGIHTGRNPEFSFMEEDEVDMNSLCARVVIFAEKPS